MGAVVGGAGGGEGGAGQFARRAAAATTAAARSRRGGSRGRGGFGRGRRCRASRTDRKKQRDVLSRRRRRRRRRRGVVVFVLVVVGSRQRQRRRDDIVLRRANHRERILRRRLPGVRRRDWGDRRHQEGIAGQAIQESRIADHEAVGQGWAFEHRRFEALLLQPGECLFGLLVVARRGLPLFMVVGSSRGCVVSLGGGGIFAVWLRSESRLFFVSRRRNDGDFVCHRLFRITIL